MQNTIWNLRTLSHEHPAASAGSLCMTFQCSELCSHCSGGIPCLWNGAFGAARHSGHQQLLQHLLPTTRQVLAGLPGFVLVFPPAHHVCHVDDGASAAQHSIQAHAAHAPGSCWQIHAQNICRYAHGLWLHCMCTHIRFAR